MGPYEACELLYDLVMIEEEDLTRSEKHLITALREPVRKYLFGTRLHEKLPEWMDELLEILSVEN